MKFKLLLLGILVVAVVAGGFWCVSLKVENIKLQQELAQQQTNAKVVNFLNLFIQKVLKSDTEVSFESRLGLETAIRDINDPELLAKWEAFTGGTNEDEIQKGVKDLLEALVKKIILE